MSRARTRRWAAGVALASLTALAALCPIAAPAGATAGVTLRVPAPVAHPAVDPRRTRGLYVDPTTTAARAGSEFGRIARKAQAMWVTDHWATPARAQAAVRGYTRRATAARKTPTLVVYAIPGRDCGGHSSGGLPDGAAYRAWVRGVAQGIGGSKPLVVLEPDAIAFMGDPGCADAGARQRMLTFAAQRLSRAGAWVYLDAGHSDWRTAEATAPLLARSGIRYARGFSTNVSNYRTTGAEQRWAQSVLAGLRSRGITGRKYVVDVSRNGAARPVSGDWCNPTWARLGPAPRLVFRGAYDGALWVKHPGESDGACQGGPNAGAWWPEGARRLMGTARAG